jgi:hypothetical protein
VREQAALAQAKLAYQLFRERFAGPRWRRLAGLGAHVQRPLWASTSTKNPADSDTLYVDRLIGPDTVTTLPEARCRPGPAAHWQLRVAAGPLEYRSPGRDATQPERCGTGAARHAPWRVRAKLGPPVDQGGQVWPALLTCVATSTLTYPARVTEGSYGGVAPTGSLRGGVRR